MSLEHQSALFWASVILALVTASLILLCLFEAFDPRAKPEASRTAFGLILTFGLILWYFITVATYTYN